LAALWLPVAVALGVLGPWIHSNEFGLSRSYYGYDGAAGVWAFVAALAAAGALAFAREGILRARIAAAAYVVAALPAALVLAGLRLIPVDDIGGLFEASWRPGWGLFVALSAGLGGAVLSWRAFEAPAAQTRREDDTAGAATLMVALPPR
jgi:hypothetical protein